MKSALVHALFTAVVVCTVHSTVTDSEAAMKLAVAAKKCEEKYNIVFNNLLKGYRDGREPETEDEKCAMSCWHQESGILKDGKFNLEKHGEITKLKFTGDDAKIEQANNIMKGCAEKIQHTGNDCIYSDSMTKCFMGTAKTEGLLLPDLDFSTREMKTNS